MLPLKNTVLFIDCRVPLVHLVQSVPQVLLVFLAHKDRKDPKDQPVQLDRKESLA